VKAKPASEEVRARWLEGFECWNGGDIDAMADMYTADAEFDMSALVDGGVRRGREGLLQFWRETWDAWQGIRMDPLDVFEVDVHRYVIATRLWGKGRHSGIEVDQRFAFLYTLNDQQLIVHAKLFEDTDAALAAAGAEA
jgi:ketosteroid isomerase-like protein